MSELPPPVFAPFVDVLDELRRTITWKVILKRFVERMKKKAGK